MTERFVICMKWGQAFGPDYVNVLYNACIKACRIPPRFLCLTDDSTGFLPGIEALPVPDIGLAPKDWYRPGVWPKIALFDGHFHGLRGRALFVDLDMVVVRDLDAFFEREGKVIGIDAGPGWGRDRATAAPTEFGSGIFAYDIGAHPHVADDFRANREGIMGRFRREQLYVHEALPEAEFWPDDWVISFKRRLRRPMGIDLFLPPREPEKTTKVIAFHGQPRPIDLIRGRPYFWDRFPHLGCGRVGWMADYWTGNGGKIT